MPSILGFLRDRILTRDPSDALFSAGVEAWKKYEETRESQYLAEAVRNHQAALNIRLPDHPRRPESLLHTAMALWAQCEGAVTKESSSTVIAYYDEALLLLPGKPGELGRRANIYTNLGMVYFTLFRLGKEDPASFPATGSNIGKAIENHRSALQLRPAKNFLDRAISLINLSIALLQKDSKDAFMSAIINLREAVELCTTKLTNRPLLLLALNSLAQAYDSHYNYSEDISDVVGKVDALRRVLDLTDEGKGRLVPLVNLTNALWKLCKLEHNRSNDLDEAILRSREALKLSDGSDNAIHVKALIALANILFGRYVQSSPKNVTNLDQAIQYYREAINPNPGNGPDPVLFCRLASAIYIRCQDFHEVEGTTLEDAISYNQEALHVCPKDDPLYLRIQNNLGSIYLTQFNKSGEEGVLVEGIQAYEDAVFHCPDDNDNFTYYQETLRDAKRALQDKREGRTDELSDRKSSDLPNSKPSDLTNSEPSDLTNSQPSDLTNSKPSDLTNSKPSDLTNVKSSDLPNSKPSDLTNSKPSNLTNSKPSDLTNFKSSDFPNSKPSDLTNSKPSDLTNSKPSTRNPRNPEMERVTRLFGHLLKQSPDESCASRPAQSVAASLHSEQSSDESCASERAASISQTD